MATTIDPRRLRERTAGLAPEGAGDGRVRAFAVARRHSILVRAMRLALPMLALAMLGIYGATTWRIATLRSAGVQLEDIRISSDNLVMAAPKYSGNGKDGSRHAVRARSAETDLLTRNRVKLTAIEGEIIQVNGTRIDLTATRGTYEQEAGVLELHEQIDVRSTDGMTANLTSATIFTKESRIVSNEPVTAQMPTGSVRARAMELKTKQRHATFTGDVAVRMVPQQKPATETETATAAETAKGVGKPKKEKASANALGPSFSSGEPVDVTSDRLTVDDATHLALFRDNVVARQGTATLTAPELDAAYAGRAALPGQSSKSSSKSAPPEGGPPAADAAASRLTSLKARGGIIMTRDSDRATATSLHYDAETQRTALAGPVNMTSGTDRRASSDNAEIDHKADQITLEGSVVLYQGRNVLKGERLAVDRANGRARLDSPAEGARGAGRISVLLHRGEAGGARTKAPAIASDTAADSRVAGAFRSDPNAPIDIDAATLDFEDARRYALFSGDVVAKQGDFVIRAPTLTAHFNSQSALLALPAGKGSEPAGAASLKKIEARGGVVITGKDGQKVTGDWADFDPASNFATVGGRVVVTQDKNVVEGSKLIMDLTSGRTRFETASPGTAETAESPITSAVPCVAGQTCTSRRRVRAVFYPKDAKKLSKSSKAAKSQSPAPADTPTAPGPATRSSQSSWQSSTTKPPETTGTPR
jgi:lipopolysaccharide transport protein LptA/LPS export ABC transporter protein LptC